MISEFLSGNFSRISRGILTAPCFLGEIPKIDPGIPAREFFPNVLVGILSFPHFLDFPVRSLQLVPEFLPGNLFFPQLLPGILFFPGFPPGNSGSDSILPHLTIPGKILGKIRGCFLELSWILLGKFLGYY